MLNIRPPGRPDCRYVKGIPPGNKTRFIGTEAVPRRTARLHPRVLAPTAIFLLQRLGERSKYQRSKVVPHGVGNLGKTIPSGSLAGTLRFGGRSPRSASRV